MSDHSSNSHVASHEAGGHTPLKPLNYQVNKVIAGILGFLGIVFIYFAVLDSLEKTSGPNTSKIENWWKKEFGPKELGGVKLGPAPETPTPAKPISATTTAIKEAKAYLVANDQTMLEIPATAGQYPNGYWISGDGDYRIGYYDMNGNFKTLYSHNYSDKEIVQFPADRNWKKPIYASCRKGWTNVKVTVHPPD